jgi:hypothetical protein
MAHQKKISCATPFCTLHAAQKAFRGGGKERKKTKAQLFSSFFFEKVGTADKILCSARQKKVGAFFSGVRCTFFFQAGKLFQ